MSTKVQNIKVAKKLILDNRDIWEISDDVGISFGSRETIFTGVIGMIRAVSKTTPKLLNFKQKQCRMDIALEMFNDLLRNVVTGGES